jgi:hypothetical protein
LTQSDIYSRTFKALDPQNARLLTGKQVFGVFSTSGLPKTVLAHVFYLTLCVFYLTLW